MKKSIGILFATLLLMVSGLARSATYVDAMAFTKVVKTSVGECRLLNTWKVPVIAWGGDIATVMANGDAKSTTQGSIFAQKKVNVTLFRQDDFLKQFESYLRCETPFLRGTMGMINMAAEVANKDPRTEPVVIYQHSWSVGGDSLVVRDDIRTPSDLRGKTIVLQNYGPHVDYLMAVLRGAGLGADDVKVRFVRDLIVIDENSISPTSVFRSDKTVSAAFVITPDALALTSGGKVGTGSEDSVKGAHVLLSTRTADTVIADVYAVRRDFLEANRAEVEAFVQGLLLASEKMSVIVKDKDGNAARFKKTMSAAAELLLDNAAALDDILGMYQDMRMVGYAGNVKFFGDSNYPRGFDALQMEIQPAFMQLGLMAKRVPIEQAGWDWKRMSIGLENTGAVDVARFDTSQVQKLLADRERTGTVGEGELFRFEIYFGPNQNVFSADQYHDSFDRVIQIATTFGGALLEVEGHSDPSNYLSRKKGGATVIERMQIKQAAKNLSFSRAGAVKDSLMGYAKTKGITMDSSQFGIVGLGVSQPNTPKCVMDASGDIDLACAPATQKEWAATRRVVFRVIQVEAETNVFKPLQ